ncbi:MAG: nuclear transport factor 2 family protein [Marmoricola sp.]
MDLLTRLTASADIANLVARRCRSLDEQDWDAYAACHTPDVVSWAIGSEQGVEEPARGIEAVISFLRKQLTGTTTVHHVHSPEIVLTTESTASGTWAMEDRLWWTAEGQERWLHGFGRYEETYERVDGRWLIASRRLVRTRVERG